MKFTAKTEKQIAEESLLPEGVYDFVVNKAEDTVSKKTGNPMIKVTIGIYQANGTIRMVDDYLMESFPRKLRRFCEVIGMLAQYDMGELNSEELEGRAGRCRLIIKYQDDYDPKNEVKDYVVDKSKRSPLPAPTFVNKPLPGEEDDLPI